MLNAALHRLDSHYFNVPVFLPRCLHGLLLCNEGAERVRLMNYFKRRTFKFVADAQGDFQSWRECLLRFLLYLGFAWRLDLPLEWDPPRRRH